MLKNVLTNLIAATLPHVWTGVKYVIMKEILNVLITENYLLQTILHSRYVTVNWTAKMAKTKMACATVLAQALIAKKIINIVKEILTHLEHAFVMRVTKWTKMARIVLIPTNVQHFRQSVNK